MAERGETLTQSTEKEVSAGKMAETLSEKIKLDRIYTKHTLASNR